MCGTLWRGAGAAGAWGRDLWPRGPRCPQGWSELSGRGARLEAPPGNQGPRSVPSWASRAGPVARCDGSFYLSADWPRRAQASHCSRCVCLQCRWSFPVWEPHPIHQGPAQAKHLEEGRADSLLSWDVHFLLPSTQTCPPGLLALNPQLGLELSHWLPWRPACR